MLLEQNTNGVDVLAMGDKDIFYVKFNCIISYKSHLTDVGLHNLEKW